MEQIKKEKNKTAIEVGKRIKLARQLANITRKEMTVLHAINSNTLQAWEKGVNRLTEENALRLVEIFRKSGLVLTVEWLLLGVDPSITIPTNRKHINQDFKDVLSIRGDLKVLEEINYFLNQNLQSISLLVTDNAIAPIFNVGDYVGGINLFSSDIDDLVGEFCIITTDDQKTLLRKIIKNCGKGNFIIGTTNPFANLNEPDHMICNLSSAAKITRHWKIGTQLLK